MKKVWVFLWYEHLKLNSDYRRYCKAVELGKRKTIAELESKYVKIAEIYRDWGDLYIGGGKRKEKAQFVNWFKSHRHLFYAKKPGSVKVITGEIVAGNHTLISIPSVLDADDATEQITELLQKLQKQGKHLRAGAKYSIYKSGVLDSTQVVALYKGLSVTLLARMIAAGSTKVKNNTDIIKHIILAKDKYWSWEFSDEDIERLKNGKMKAIELQDHKRQVARYKKYAETTIANTLTGVFPVKDKIL
jgi:hypothetical protein